MQSTEINRRNLLVAGAMLTGAAITPAALWARVAKGETARASAAERLLLAAVSDFTIPATDTPGAVALKVPAWVELALAHGLDGSSDAGNPSAVTVAFPRPLRPHGGLGWIAQLRTDLNKQAGGDFLTAPRAQQLIALTALDAAAFAPGAERSAWLVIKRLIVTGYYTSETGASKELRYELEPGRFDPDVPVTSETRALSSDWMAVEFG